MTVLEKPLQFPLVIQFFQPLLGQPSVLVSPEKAKEKETSVKITLISFQLFRCVCTLEALGIYIRFRLSVTHYKSG